MKIFGYLCVFLGLASLEEKRKAGKELFESIVSVLPKPLEQTDDEQIDFFKITILPQYDAQQISCLKAHFEWMLVVNEPEGACGYREEQCFMKWSVIYRSFLEALPE